MRRGDRQLFEEREPQHITAARICRKTEIENSLDQVFRNETMIKIQGNP